MTADMPDAVKVAREALAARCDKLGTPFYAAAAHDIRAGKSDDGLAMRDAILGARAMQAAMAGREVNGVDGATPAPVISDETINTVRAHAIHNAAQGGMPQAEAEDHFGTPTPAGAGDLVEQLRRGTGIRNSVLYTEADAHAADCTMKEAASRIEALEAEVAAVGHRRLTEALTMVDAAEARATTAEAERDALKAEVERKDKALAVVREQAARTEEIVLALLAQINPHVDLAEGPSQLFFSLHDQIKIHGPAARKAALAPAKAGG